MKLWYLRCNDRLYETYIIFTQKSNIYQLDAMAINRSKVLIGFGKLFHKWIRNLNINYVNFCNMLRVIMPNVEQKINKYKIHRKYKRIPKVSSETLSNILPNIKIISGSDDINALWNNIRLRSEKHPINLV